MPAPIPRRLIWLWLLMAVVVVGVGRRIHGELTSSYEMTERVRIHPNRPLSVPHPLLGRGPNAGTFDVTISVPATTIPYHFRVVTGADGYRTTSADPAATLGRPEVWIFGCSFTWGMALDNEDTYPWRLQEMLQEKRVRNFGVYAYGNHHALLQLRSLLEGGGPRPETAVFAYCSFHRKRNVAAPTWLRLENSIRRQPEAMRYPRGRLVDGRLEIDLVGYDVPEGQEDPPEAEANQVTVAIFAELGRLCREQGVRAILAVQSRAGAEDPVPDRVAEIAGFEVVEMIVDATDPRYNLLPYNSHPNAEANRIYAERLRPVLDG